MGGTQETDAAGKRRGGRSEANWAVSLERKEAMNNDVLITWPAPPEVDERKPEVGEGDTPDAEAWLKLICRKLKDPKFQAFDILRLITVAIASVVEQILSLGCTVDEVSLRKRHAEEVKLLRNLGKQVVEGEALRRKEDVLNFDGPKFRFIFVNVTTLFVQAMTKARIEEAERQTVLKLFRDLLIENEPRIRRETEKIES